MTSPVQAATTAPAVDAQQATVTPAASAGVGATGSQIETAAPKDNKKTEATQPTEKKEGEIGTLQKIGNFFANLPVIGFIFEKIFGLFGFVKTAAATTATTTPADPKKEVETAKIAKEAASKKLADLLQKDGKEDATLKTFSEAVKDLKAEERKLDATTLATDEFKALDEKVRNDIIAAVAGEEKADADLKAAEEKAAKAAAEAPKKEEPKAEDKKEVIAAT